MYSFQPRWIDSFRNNFVALLLPLEIRWYTRYQLSSKQVGWSACWSVLCHKLHLTIFNTGEWSLKWDYNIMYMQNTCLSVHQSCSELLALDFETVIVWLSYSFGTVNCFWCFQDRICNSLLYLLVQANQNDDQPFPSCF